MCIYFIHMLKVWKPCLIRLFYLTDLKNFELTHDKADNDHPRKLGKRDRMVACQPFEISKIPDFEPLQLVQCQMQLFILF